MLFPMVRRVIEAVPDFDLHDDLALGRFLEHQLEAPPVLVVPLFEVVFAVGPLGERINFEAAVLAVAHRVADVIAAGGYDLVEVLFQIGNLKQVVVLAAADEQNWLALVLPIMRILFVRSNAIGIVGGMRRRGKTCGEGE